MNVIVGDLLLLLTYGNCYASNFTPPCSSLREILCVLLIFVNVQLIIFSEALILLNLCRVSER